MPVYDWLQRVDLFSMNVGKQSIEFRVKLTIVTHFHSWADNRDITC